MGFSYTKAAVLRPQKEKGFSIFLIALAVAATFFVPYMVMSDGYFTFYGDFNAQQIPFYQLCHKAIIEGNFFWNNYTDLGVNFIGSYSFYLLGSPFFWITLLFPNSFVPYLMGPLFILKFGCAALTAYFYIRRFTRTPEAASLGALLYAFSGFSIYNIFFNHFHEAIIVFPLLLLSLELLITENRRFVFALMVCVCAITNYFFFFGMVVFCVIYFLVRVFNKDIRVSFARFATLVFEAVIGLALSAALLVPSILAITNNYRVSEFLLGWNALMYGKEQIYGNVLQCFFFPPDIPARPVFFPGADVEWSSLGGWLPIFSMVGVFTVFSQRKGSWIKRLIAICIFMALVPILNSAFYAFNDSYYARWYYMPILIMCLATVSLTEDRSVDWTYGYRWVFGITVAVSLVIGLFPQKDSEGKILFGIFSRGSSKDDYIMYLCRYWATVAIALVGLAILWILLKFIKNNLKIFYRVAIASVCIITIIYANFFVACGRSHSYDKAAVVDGLIEGEIDFEDDSEFRIDVFDGMDNTGMYLGYSTINAFHSIVPSSVFEFYDYVGVKRSVGSRPEADAYNIRPLLSVKYLINPKYGDSFVDEESGETEMPGYKYLKTQNGFYIYENENYIPYGFSYEYYMTEEFCDGYSEDDRASMMLKAIKLSDEQIEKYGKLLKNIEKDENVDHYGSDSTSLSLSYAAMEYDCKKLAETSAHYFKFDNRGFTAKVIRQKENLVFFSVPYDEGWSATVNGKPVEVEKVNSGFMAVKVDAGMSEIRFNYITPGLKVGLIITICSATVFLIYMLAFIIFIRKSKEEDYYPEGEKLLKKWRMQELGDLRREQQREPKSVSLLDDNSNIEIPDIDEGLMGGFKIDTEAFKDDTE